MSNRMSISPPWSFWKHRGRMGGKNERKSGGSKKQWGNKDEYRLLTPQGHCIPQLTVPMTAYTRDTQGRHLTTERSRISSGSTLPEDLYSVNMGGDIFHFLQWCSQLVTRSCFCKELLKAILSKKNNAGRLPYLKIYYRVTVIKTICYRHKNKHADGTVRYFLLLPFLILRTLCSDS